MVFLPWVCYFISYTNECVDVVHFSLFLILELHSLSDIFSLRSNFIVIFLFRKPKQNRAM